jgi:hypothetical protein
VTRDLVTRIVLTLVGATLLIVSAFLPWLGFEGGPRGTEVPVQFLWSPAERPAPAFVASLGFVAIVLGLLVIAGLAPRTGVLTSLAGAAAIAVFVLAVITLYRVEGEGSDLGVQDIGIGAWLELLGGIVAVIGGFFGARSVNRGAAPVATA